ncbi:MAG: helix-turn-helix transcriptional regulator [Legionellales bacterium]|nr:helix-turn-helix transcriptional regulator [Legionellales bacterium]
MSVHTRKHPIKESASDNIVHVMFHGKDYYVPENVLAPYYVKPETEKMTLSAAEVFSNLEYAHTKPGLLLKGLRAKENLSQVEFAKKINITQSNLSNMENGHRPIGKELAKRIAFIFKVDYRYFL